MKKETNSLPERFAAKGQEFIDDLQANCRYGCGVLWWKCGCGWMPERPGTVSLHLRCRYNATHKEAAQIRRAIPALEPGCENPEFLRAVRRYARKRGMQFIDGQWVRVPKAKWNAMPVEEYTALIMQEYDQNAFSPEDWKKLAELHAKEIRLSRSSGKKIDAASRRNSISGALTAWDAYDDILWIQQQRDEIFKRTFPRKVS